MSSHSSHELQHDEAEAASSPSDVHHHPLPNMHDVNWPHLSTTQYIAIWAVNIAAFIAAYVWLRIIWPSPSMDELRREKELEKQIQSLKANYQSIPVNGNDSDTGSSSMAPEVKEMYEGESAGDYSAPWTSTFDLTFVIIMAIGFILLAVWTTVSAPELWVNPLFWLSQLPKLLTMMLVSYIGGLLCRYFCEHDEKGYIITNRESVFKVNYTRKLQHFAAYMVPLLLHTTVVSSHVPPDLTLAWGDWVTLLGFLILIKPIRESIHFVMLQFNALDRPEDRPNTISWIVGGNIIPGCVLIVFFRWLYHYTGQEGMAYIFIFITGIGDGLAEPVGIYLGTHKYWTSSLGGGRRYQRSWEGSACVFISSIIFVSLLWYTFANAWQFWVAMLVLPPLMTYAEATSPHTLDTPFLMGLGGFALFVISHINVKWR